MGDYKRPYIVLNDVSSESIDGLLITSLPPVRKPAMRYTAEEIDGVEGDTITELGFKSYDKTVQIGLFGDYDVDRVIQYFTGGGKVTFSNEPDKYYLYKSLGAIDFDRLVRFRKAKVTLHVQPYKYSTMEHAKTWNVDGATPQIRVKNSGNVNSCPMVRIVGSGIVAVYLNGKVALSISVPPNGIISIDVAGMNAYKSDGTLANRNVVGDYRSLELPVGTNAISWTGNVTGFGIDKYSRWI